MATKKFRCKICGYIHEGDAAPAKCPMCQAPASEFEEIVEETATPELVEATPAPRKKGLNTNGNTYTIVYAAGLVIIVAFLLAFVSSVLKPTQDANVERDTKNQILTSLNIKSSNVDADFDKIVKDNLIRNGKLTPYEGAFQTSYGQELKAGNLHLFVATLENGEIKYVIPMTGR
ncbi:MAG: Na(+)-translocating NADH:ubiquinone reductase subunit C, partial [Bacteroidales bacterium]|nr:Na(+)-translocating NADH:ubiquinone reductase subunit C [Bacteroidales bacterium]